jgi:hypothetical protein
MKLKIDNELRNICQEILDEDKTEEEWKEIPSGDMFQSKQYCGGYEENGFWFSYFNDSNREYWFRIALTDISKIISGEITEIDIKEAPE